MAPAARHRDDRRSRTPLSGQAPDVFVGQHLIRLPLTGALLFLIDVRPLPLERVALVPEWTDRLVSVLETLPPEVAEYKELDRLGALALDYLSSCSGSLPK